MISRLKQFWFGMMAKYHSEDEIYTKKHLSLPEKELFDKLPEFEKKHAVVVAQKMVLASYQHPELDKNKLIKLGLLHDIGKITERNSIFAKSIFVVFRFFSPGLYDRFAKLGETNSFFKRYYVHKNHGVIGAKILETIGEEPQFLSIIKKHDPRVEPFGPEDPLELKILQDADSTY
jgi:putative nucleotidyltransferase with HDIG domain